MARRRRGAQVARRRPTTGDQVRLNWDQGPVYYANAVDLGASLWDIKLRFAEVLEVREKKTIVMRELAKVYLSPQHAAVLAAALANSIREYEKQFGKIPGPPATS